MSDLDIPINPKTLANLRRLLGQFAENIGADRQQLEADMRDGLGGKDLPEALKALRVSDMLTTHMMYGVNPIMLFSLQIQVAKGKEGTIDEITIDVMFTPPGAKDAATLASLCAGKSYRLVGAVWGIINTFDPKLDSLHKDDLDEEFQAIRQNFGEGLVDVFRRLYIAMANAIPAEDMHDQAKLIQTFINEEYGTEGSAAPLWELPFSEEMTARVQTMLPFLEAVYGLEEGTLYKAFEDQLFELVNENAPLTAGLLMGCFVDIAELQGLGCGITKKQGEANALSFLVPLHDNNGRALDHLIIDFSPENTSVELESGHLVVDEATPQENYFDGKEVAKLAKASAVLSEEQAAQNKALLKNALGELTKIVTGKSLKTAQQALLVLSTLE